MPELQIKVYQQMKVLNKNKTDLAQCLFIFLLFIKIYNFINISNWNMTQKADTSDASSSFKVYIRIRPLNQAEILALNSKDEFLQYNETQISLKTRTDGLVYTFDKIYHPETSQQQIFDNVADQIIEQAFAGTEYFILLGINGTIFCYGQTATGKTHTIIGDYISQNFENQGLLPRTLAEAIRRRNAKLQNLKDDNIDIRIKISMIQIYNQKIMDLFDPKKKNLKLRQNKKKGFFIDQVSQNYIASAQQAINYITIGLQNRTVGRTNLNSYSSRSHMLFIITIHETNFHTKEAKSAKITITDLAGSQKLSKSGVKQKMIEQTKNINTSLSALGKVINALSQKSSHIPYRDSKLTRLLQESIGGNSLTRLIINISPSSINQSQTLSSLRFGSRAKLIKNKPKFNKEYTVEQLLILLEKAEHTIKQQMKIISALKQGKTNFQKDGELADLFHKAITLHIIEDNEFDNYGDENSSVKSHPHERNGTFNCGLSEISTKKHAETQRQVKSPSKGSCRTKSLDKTPQFEILKSLQIDSLSIELRQRDEPRQKSCTTRKNKNKIAIFYESNDEYNKNLRGDLVTNLSQTPNHKHAQKKKRRSKSLDYNRRFNSATFQSLKLDDLIQDNNQTHQKKQFNTQKVLAHSGNFINQKQNEVVSLNKETKEKLLSQCKQQIKASIRLQQQQKIKKQLISEILVLNAKVQSTAVQIKVPEIQFDDWKFKYQQSMKVIEEQKKVIKAKDQKITQLNQKYQSKKNKINVQINKLQQFWQNIV